MRSSNNKNTLFNSQDDDLIDYFININRYTPKDIESLKSKYSENTHPLAASIFDLLYALEQFYFATTIEISFKRDRDNASKRPCDGVFKQQMLGTFTKMHAALTCFENAAAPNADAKIVKHASQYVVAAICARIETLEQIQDPLFISYQENVGNLKDYIFKNKMKQKI